jgi:hypothetical protein
MRAADKMGAMMAAVKMQNRHVLSTKRESKQVVAEWRAYKQL